jgi:hypothetical protein
MWSIVLPGFRCWCAGTIRATTYAKAGDTNHQLDWTGRDGARNRWFADLYGAFPVKWFFSVYCQFFVRRCVQVRLACSAGGSPAGVKVRAP